MTSVIARIDDEGVIEKTKESEQEFRLRQIGKQDIRWFTGIEDINKLNEIKKTIGEDNIYVYEDEYNKKINDNNYNTNNTFFTLDRAPDANQKYPFRKINTNNLAIADYVTMLVTNTELLDENRYIITVKFMQAAGKSRKRRARKSNKTRKHRKTRRR